MNRRIAIILSIVGFVLMACNCGGGAGPQQQPNQNVIIENKKENTDPPKVEPPAFLKPDQAANLGTFRVALLSGGIGKVNYTDDIRRTTSPSTEDRLWIKISIVNTSETKLEQYKPWSGRDFAFEKENASIKDEFGNNYFNLRGTTSFRPTGQLHRMTRLDPGKSIEDILVFDRPIEKATEFTLELPGGNIGQRNERIVYKLDRKFFTAK